MDVADVLFTTRGMPSLDAALAFARAGIRIFPCASGGKRPLTHAGFHDASRDVAQVRSWWTRWPAANLGLPTGSASGIEVVDIDVADAGSGFVTFERASAAGMVAGELARVRTPSGGLHVYFPALPSHPQRCWQSAVAHIDFRGEGGYVVVPPSALVTNNGRVAYRVVSLFSSGSTSVDAAALRDFIDPGHSRSEPPPDGAAAAAPAPTRLARWIANLHEGERNSGLFWAACRLLEAGSRPAEVEAALAPAAASAGLSEREIRTTIHSANRQSVRMPLGSTAATWSYPVTPRHRDGDAPCLS
ncbi:bifunctional DNA primase/polymerase [Microterricola viridarii]|uniref:Bifunctional DNA primase/polymerase, N-terminal n=1 Tax=Microterricola viridarii TaxID=412690 RepID=A0A1H1VFT8_9MICO|nr:bifunctional DNA primase/polymerase [Microterricola viridarii]SDS83535.1 Bifunctional DNA primase/polymerase, N-terminal [Microterricola viridarii]